MGKHRVQRLPVINGRTLIGKVTEADVARHAPADRVINLVQNVYADGPAGTPLGAADRAGPPIGPG